MKHHMPDLDTTQLRTIFKEVDEDKVISAVLDCMKRECVGWKESERVGGRVSGSGRVRGRVSGSERVRGRSTWARKREAAFPSVVSSCCCVFWNCAI